ncbi:MAG: phosphoadenylyl-sulfate reductase [Helicobacteraceae bacterium]|jgi:phosphoadenosine phosphosulfate reductase|nr:phosphoadenylyl-sulfate reductase [Helicobacteraceae bacterium]
MSFERILSEVKGAIALSFSYQAEDSVALDLLRKSGAEFEVFTLDTGKLFTECEALRDETERFFGVKIKRYFPDLISIAELERDLGEWGMRESLEKRKRCCETRKVEPLTRALRGKAAWVTGLRAAQSVTRADLKIAEFDEKFGLLKINPIVTWSEAEVFGYIADRGIPINSLYSRGFKSIGCAPCTRAVREGEDSRAGRWWWENPEHKECGLHIK